MVILYLKDLERVDTMIEFCHITKTFKKDFWARPFLALDDVSFEIRRGDATGFLGANGAGKTTLLKILMNFIPLNSGEIKFSGILGKDLKEALNRIGFLPERPYFYPHLTGREFSSYMGQLNNVPKSKLKEKIEYWSNKLSIEHALDRPLHGYSKGMLQRMGLVTTLLHDPEILILDEPLSGLDPVGRKEVKNVISELIDEGKTVFFSSHIVNDIEEVCRSVVVLEKGKCIYEGEISKLIGQNTTSTYELSFNFSEQLKIEGLNLTQRQGSYHRGTFDEGQKHNILNQLLKNQVDIISLEPQKPSLEQVIYNIKS